MSRPPDPTAKISLLRASEAVFAEKGLTLAKVEDITRLAGMSKGAFYLHFESKEEAFKQVVESFLARCAANLPPPGEVEMPSHPEEVLAMWLELDTQMYEFLWQNRATVAILMGCQGPHVYLLEAFNASMMRRSQDWLEAWKKNGFVRSDLDTELGATILNGAHHQMCTTILALPKKPNLVEMLARAQTIFARGFGTQLLIDALGDGVDNPPVSQSFTQENGKSGKGNRQGFKRRTNAKVS